MGVKDKIYRLRFFLQANPHIKGFFFILVLVLILPITIGAALTVQNLRQRASGSENLKIVDVSGNPLPATISDPNIYLQITLPSDWKLSSPPRETA